MSNGTVPRGARLIAAEYRHRARRRGAAFRWNLFSMAGFAGPGVGAGAAPPSRGPPRSNGDNRWITRAAAAQRPGKNCSSTLVRSVMARNGASLGLPKSMHTASCVPFSCTPLYVVVLRSLSHQPLALAPLLFCVTLIKCSAWLASVGSLACRAFQAGGRPSTSGGACRVA